MIKLDPSLKVKHANDFYCRCKNVVSVPRLFESLVNKDLSVMAGKFLAVEDFQVVKLYVNRCTKVVSLDCEAKEEFNFFTGSDKIKVSEKSYRI